MRAHWSEPVHVAAPPPVAGQHTSPAAPHAHVPETHSTPPLHVVPLQHSSPAPPHSHVPFAHERLVPHAPAQQGSLAPPHATQPASVHSCPVLQFEGLHAGAAPLELPELPLAPLLPEELVLEPPLLDAPLLLDASLLVPPVVASSEVSITVPV